MDLEEEDSYLSGLYTEADEIMHFDSEIRQGASTRSGYLEADGYRVTWRNVKQ
jgi:hypothetical protein